MTNNVLYAIKTNLTILITGDDFFEKAKLDIIRKFLIQKCKFCIVISLE